LNVVFKASKKRLHIEPDNIAFGHLQTTRTITRNAALCFVAVVYRLKTTTKGNAFLGNILPCCFLSTTLLHSKIL